MEITVIIIIANASSFVFLSARKFNIKGHVQISATISGIDMALLLKLLLNSGLIFFATAATTKVVVGENWENDEISYHLSEFIEPLHYDVNIIFHNGSNSFHGKSNINFYLLRNTSSIYLHSKYVYVDNSTTLINKITREVYAPSETFYYVTSQICMFYFDDEIQTGTYILNLNFTGDIYNHDNSNGIFKITYTTDDKQNHTLFAAGDFQQTTGLRWIIPCWDELTFKTTFNISVYHPKNSIAISNMPIKSEEYIGANMLWTHFQTTLPMSTYHVAITVSDLIQFSLNIKHIQMWCRNWETALQLNFALNIAETTTEYLKRKYFQNIVKFDEILKIDHVAIPGNRDEGLTNWGLVFYSEKAITCDEEWKSIQRMIEVASLVSRKVVHQLFSNMVTPSDWSYMWLNEGIATFLGLYAVDKVFPYFRMMDLSVVETRYKCLYMESHDDMPPVALKINQPTDIKLFSSFRYTKASAIFRMLHFALTDEVFQMSLNRYLNINIFRSTSPDDLWSIMQLALDNLNHEYNITIKELMDTWTTRRHYPTLKMLRNYHNGRTIIWSEIRNASNQDDWRIPVIYATQTNPNFNITYVQEWLSHKSFLYLPSIDKNDWIIINLQQIAYCRVMYDRENWRRIAKYLNSDEYNKIHVLNRAQIIDDAYHFLILKELDFDTFKELTRYLSQETDYIAWYPMFKIFGYMLNIFSHPEATFIKEHMQNIVCDLLKKIGYDDKPDEDVLIKSLRAEAAEWACVLGDENCREIAHRKLENYLANPDLKKVSKKWIHCGGLMTANRTILFEISQLYSAMPDEVILEYLPCFKEPEIIWVYLQIIKSNATMTDDDYNNIFFTTIAFHANNDETLASLFRIFEEVRPRKLSFMKIMKDIIKYMYTKTQFQMINNFVETNAVHLVSSVQREIRKHMFGMNNLIDSFQNSAISKSLDHSKSMYFDSKAIEILIELMCSS